MVNKHKKPPKYVTATKCVVSTAFGLLLAMAFVAPVYAGQFDNQINNKAALPPDDSGLDAPLTLPPEPGTPDDGRHQNCAKVCKRYECCEWSYGTYDQKTCKKECCAEYIERCE